MMAEEDAPKTPDAVKRAEDALTTLSPQFDAWLTAAIRRLVNAGQGFADDPNSEHAQKFLARAALDIKSLGTTVGYPLMTRVGASLVRCLDIEHADPAAILAMTRRHISAVTAIAQAKAKNPHSVRFSALAGELEADVTGIRKKSP